MYNNKPASLLLILAAFAAVYIIWGSTYFFIELTVKYIPPMVIGGLRFLLSGSIMLMWVAFRGERIFDRSSILSSAISGILMLFIGNGAVIWAEQYLHSSFVAIFLASAPVWFLIFDKPKWNENFLNKFTIIGVCIGLIGVILLFYEKMSGQLVKNELLPLLIIFLGNIGWVLGSLFSKYKVKSGSPSLNAAWQMLSAGVAFSLIGIFNGSFATVNWAGIPNVAWFSLIYLVIFGSIIGYSAYVFLLGQRSATQVSSYAYVNPLVAVVLGVFINHDKLTAMQYLGLGVILCSVLFINLAKKERRKKLQKISRV